MWNNDDDSMNDDALILDFAPEEVQQDSFEPLPAGTYRCHVAEVRPQTTKAGNGTMIKTRLVVDGGPYNGRVIFDSPLIRHSSETAQRIGQQKIAAMLASAGLPTERNLARLVGEVVTAVVVIEAKEGYEPRNQVKRYVAGSSSAQQQAAPVAAAAPGASAKKAPPAFMTRK